MNEQRGAKDRISTAIFVFVLVPTLLFIALSVGLYFWLGPCSIVPAIPAGILLAYLGYIFGLGSR